MTMGGDCPWMKDRQAVRLLFGLDIDDPFDWEQAREDVLEEIQKIDVGHLWFGTTDQEKDYNAQLVRVKVAASELRAGLAAMNSDLFPVMAMRGCAPGPGAISPDACLSPWAGTVRMNEFMQRLAEIEAIAGQSFAMFKAMSVLDQVIDHLVAVHKRHAPHRPRKVSHFVSMVLVKAGLAEKQEKKTVQNRLSMLKRETSR